MIFINIVYRRLLLLGLLAYIVVPNIEVFFGLPLWAKVFYTIMLVIFWWLLIGYMNIVCIRGSKVFMLKVLYVRRIDLNDIRVVTEYTDTSKHDWFFGKLFVIKIRMQKGIHVVIPFTKEKSFQQFIQILSSNTKLEVIKEEQYNQKNKSKIVNKFKEYASGLSNVSTSTYDQIVLDAFRGNINQKLNDKLAVKITQQKYTMNKNKPVIHGEGLYQDHWFQYVFTYEGVMICVDGLVMENELSSYHEFCSSDEVYLFIIESFNCYLKQIKNPSKS